MNKYELTDETRTVQGVILYRIRALKDFGKVRAGSLGGFLASEKNLDQEGNAWVLISVLLDWLTTMDFLTSL